VTKVEDQNIQTDDLKEEIIRLGPWHLDVQVTPEISTRAYLDAPEGTFSSVSTDPTARQNRQLVTFISPREGFVNLMKRVYPAGLEGRTFLDCACNCGGYSFWAKELGASECLGFDVRDHWINQARFLAANRVWPSDGIRFEVLDLYDLPKLDLEPFDITLFKGIFYHLPDPITGLKAAADLTREVVILDTAMRNDLPDGMLAVGNEGRAQVMTGVYGLNWHPTGPKVLTRILNWLGFTEVRVILWRGNHRKDRPDLGRIRLIASRKKGLLDAFESVEAPS
jgi:SAM-dependent methyltransferase